MVRPDKIDITINATINVVDAGTTAKLNEILEIVKGQAFDKASLAESLKIFRENNQKLKVVTEAAEDATP